MTNGDDAKAQAPLVKATDLPIHGNPYPPKDKVLNEQPSALTLRIASMRQSMEPVLGPISQLVARTNHIVSTGVAHSQSAWQSVAHDQRAKFLAVYSGAFLITFTRRGLFRKLLFGAVTFPLAAAICKPVDAREKGERLLYLAKNKLPGLVSEQYKSLVNPKSTPQTPTDTSSETQIPKDS